MNNKKIIYTIFILLIIIVTTSCLNSYSNQQKEERSIKELKESKDLLGLKNKQKEIVKEYNDLSNQLTEINLAIEELDTTKKVPLVTAIALSDTLFKHFIQVQGSLDTRQNIVLNSEFTGTITRSFVKEGDYVRKGQILAKIDDGGLSLQLAQRKSELDLAKTTFERQKRLWSQKIGSEIEYLQAKTRYESLKNEIGALQVELSKTAIRAPFSGTIDDVIREQGEVVVSDQSPVLRLINLREMYVRADIPENFLNKIKQGSIVEVEIPSLNRVLEGKIRQISNYINPNNRSFSIEVSIKNEDQSLKPNLIAHVKINDYTEEKALVIPENIIKENAEGDQFVFQLVNINERKIGTVRRVKIQTGMDYNSYTEVLEGLKKGDILVSEGSKTMTDNLRVKVTEE